jgi:phosphoribosylamine--glycine ligase
MLTEVDMAIDPRAASTVILASAGYPGAYEKGVEIEGLEAAAGIDGVVFHAGTKESRRKIYTAGGRVLALTGFGMDLEAALKNSYRLAARVGFKGGFYRKDIGADVLEEAH